MQAEVYSAGGATSPTPVTTVVSGDLQVQSVPNGQSATSENPAFHSISTSAVTFAPEQSSVSFARKREPSETETTITTDIVALPLDSSSNLRQRSSVVKMQKQGAYCRLLLWVSSNLRLKLQFILRPDNLNINSKYFYDKHDNSMY